MCVSVMLPSRCVGLDEVVARVEVAVVLERDRVAAGLAEDAQRRRAARARTRARRRTSGRTPCRRRGVTHSSNTAIRNAAPGVGVDRPVGDRVALLEPGLVVALDDRDELDVAGPEVVAEEAVHVERVVLVRGVDRAEHVARRRRGASSRSRPAHAPCRRWAGPSCRRGTRRAARRGPSMLMPTRKWCSARSSHHSSVSSVPLVWIVCCDASGRAGGSCSTSATARRKKSTPMSVGSPPCQAIVDLRAGLRLEELADVGLEQRRRSCGTGRPGTAPPSTGRSSTRSRGCRSARSAWPARGTTGRGRGRGLGNAGSGPGPERLLVIATGVEATFGRGPSRCRGHVVSGKPAKASSTIGAEYGHPEGVKLRRHDRRCVCPVSASISRSN